MPVLAPALLLLSTLAPEPRVSALEADPDGHLKVEVDNYGTAPMTVPAQLSIAVDGHVAETITVPGPGMYVSSTRAIGRERHVGVRLLPDPANELTTRNQWLARRVKVDDVGRANVAVVDLRGGAGNLEFKLRNEGAAASSAETFYADVFVDGELYSTLAVEVPDLGPLDEIWIDTFRYYPAGMQEVVLRPGSIDNDADTTDNWRREALPWGLDLSDLHALLSDPYIVDAIQWHSNDGTVSYYWDWPWDAQERLEFFYTHIAEGRDPLPLRPVRDDDECLYQHIEAFDVFLSHVAQSLWFENTGRSDYSLYDYDEESLAMLLDSRSLVRDDLNEDTPQDTCFRYAQAAFPWSSMMAYGFMEGLGLIDPDARATVMNVADWARDNLDHGFTAPGAAELYYGPGKIPRLEAMLYAVVGDSNVSNGCGGTASLLHGVLRTVNIPVESVRLQLGATGHHTSVNFPTLGLHIVHGDDLYGVWGRVTYARHETVPSDHVFMSDADYARLIESPVVDCVAGACNPIGVQRLDNAFRYAMNARIADRSTSLLTLRAAANPFYEDIFRPSPSAVAPVYSAAERVEIEAMLDARLVDWGDGDPDLGLDRVWQVQSAMARRFVAARP